MVKRKLTNQNILSFKELYNSGLSSWAIAKKFNTEHSNILYHLKKLGISRRNRSSAAKEGVSAGRIIIKRNYIPKNLRLNENLAYILGVLAGDGYMDYSEERRAHSIGLSAIDKEFVQRFRETLFKFFKIKSSNEFRKSRREKWNNQYITRLCSKEACDFINSIGDFTKYKWSVPELIKNSSEDIKCAFLSGFFDSEGEIDKKSKRVGATSVNLAGLEEIGFLLKNIGIRYTIIGAKLRVDRWNRKYILRIHDKKSIDLFKNKIGFTIKRKMDRLDNVKEATMFPRDRERLTP